MIQLHPSYEQFIKKQMPKYGKTFMEWYAENYRIDGKNILDLIDKGTSDSANDSYNATGQNMIVTYYKDFFTKKLQLCCNIINLKSNGSFINPSGAENFMLYDIDKAPDIMDLYEEIIQEICTGYNIGVCDMPAGMYYNNTKFETRELTFDSLEALKREISSGEVVVYYFIIDNDFRIIIRMAKREVPLSRNILNEKA